MVRRHPPLLGLTDVFKHHYCSENVGWGANQQRSVTMEWCWGLHLNLLVVLAGNAGRTVVSV